MRVAGIVWVLFVTVNACGAAPAPRESVARVVAPAAAPAGNGNGTSRVMASALVRVVWSSVVSTPGCFFFSGPGALGRDDHFGETADLASGADTVLGFGDGRAFHGLSRSGPLALERDARHEFGGTWRTHETLLVQPLDGGAWRGRYHYDEYGPGTQTAGMCHIDADVMLLPE